MTNTVHAPDAETPNSTPDFTDPAVQARVLDEAADLIKAYGRQVGDWWARPLGRQGFPVLTGDYVDGSCLCAVGAIAVSMGFRTNNEVFTVVCGLDDEDPGDEGRRPPHPVVREVMKALRCTKVEHVFDWSDEARDDQIVGRLREIAAELRAQAVA